MVDRRDEGSAPFNMALATLERVNDILKQISISSVTILDLNNRNYVKYKLLKELYQTSVPLIDNKDTKDNLRKKINKMPSDHFKKRVNQVTKSWKLICKTDTEDTIDELVEEIQEALQLSRYFMPSKHDPKFGWRES